MSETKATRPYPLRIPEGLMELAEAKARVDRVDRSTALRQLLYAGAEGYALDLLAQGRISVGRAAQILGVSVHRVHELARERHTQIGATSESYRRSREAAGDLLR